MRNLLFVAILAYIFIISMGQRSPGGKNICPDAVNRFTDTLCRISMRFLKSYADAYPCETGAVTGYAALSAAVTMAYFAEGESKNEILAKLNIKSNDEILCIADAINNPVYNLPDCIKFQALYGIIGDVEYQFTPEFINFVAEVIYINGQARNLDFSNGPETAHILNALCANLTNNKIPIIIEDSSIFNSSLQLVSVNGWSFKSEWEIEFQTKKLEFKMSPTESVLQEFLYQDAVYLNGHSDILGADIVQVNFCCGSNFYIWIIVPDCPFTVDALIDNMSQNIDWYYKVKPVLKCERLDLYVVRFDKSTTVENSKDLFIDAGNYTIIYNNETLNLKGAIESDKPAALSLSIQKTYVSSSPEGGPVPNGPLSNGSKKTFIANTPHVFIIFREQEVYFTGVIRGPIS